ncbi:MAG: glycosyltransferase family 2 protein, partial [Bacteroidales bacterium]|nr:glycosyltransferase family 2 protein [Bacteroidales bacterium]
MITVLALVSLGLLLLRLIVSLVNLIMPVHLHKSKGLSKKSLSVLIPARNEENNIGRLVHAVLAMHHQVEEVLIYDDGSTDRTWEMIREMQILDPRVRGIQGGRLPEAWLGKNYACHCLASEARSELLLFLDADVVPEAGLASDLAARLESQCLDLISIFPVQRMQGRGEWMSVPLMNWILLSLLPLSLVRLSRRPSLSAANGQCML